MDQVQVQLAAPQAEQVQDNDQNQVEQAQQQQQIQQQQQQQQQQQGVTNSYSPMVGNGSDDGGNMNSSGSNMQQQWPAQFAPFTATGNGQNMMYNPKQAWGAAPSMPWKSTSSTNTNDFPVGAPNSVPVTMAHTNTQRLVNHLNSINGNNGNGTVDATMALINAANSTAVSQMPMNFNAHINVNNVNQPIYVNAKQYRRIVKRREARTILDEYFRKKRLANEVITSGDESGPKVDGTTGASSKRSYTHESRHRHAMKRPRGPGGRFLTKVGYIFISILFRFLFLTQVSI